MRTNLAHAWGGIWRMVLRRHFTRGHGLALVGMLAVLGLIFFAFLQSGNGSARFLPFTVGFYFSFLVPLLAFIGGGGAWSDELRPEAADYFLVRPVPRGLYLPFRYLAHLLCAQIDFACALAVLLALAAARHVPDLGAAWPAMLAAQAASVAAFSAFGFFCAMFASHWVIVGLVYGALVEIGVSAVPLSINRLAMTHQARRMLQALIARAGSGVDLADLGARPALVAAGILVLFAAAWVALAAALFSRAEITGGRGGDS